MLKILFIGDVCGKMGRKTIANILPELKKELNPDLVVANAENSAHGVGVTDKTLKELMDAGVDWFTNGDHAFDQEKFLDLYKNFPTIRPANYSQAAPGNGYAVIKVKESNILLINLVGRVFMSMDYECPFRKIDEILANKDLAEKNFSAIIVDIHAEATSEKIAIGHYLDGRVSATIGTHTHVMTADQKITEKGTAYITDVGMVGFADGCIGVGKEGIIDTFITQIKHQHVMPEIGKAIFNAVLLSIDTETKKTVEILPIIKFININ